MFESNESSLEECLLPPMKEKLTTVPLHRQDQLFEFALQHRLLPHLLCLEDTAFSACLELAD